MTGVDEHDGPWSVMGLSGRVGHVVARTVCRGRPSAGSECAVLSVPHPLPTGTVGVPDGDRIRGARGQDPWATGPIPVVGKPGVSASRCNCGVYGYAVSLLRCVRILSFCQFLPLTPAPGAEGRNGVFFMVGGSFRVVRPVEAPVRFFCPRKPFARCRTSVRRDFRMSASWKEEEREVQSAVRQHLAREVGRWKDIHMTLHADDGFSGNFNVKSCLCE